LVPSPSDEIRPFAQVRRSQRSRTCLEPPSLTQCSPVGAAGCGGSRM
jgi:hypothetical protein